MENFTPITASVGGALIGLSAVLLMGGLGRIAGISGIMGGALFRWPADGLWRWSFLIGLVAAPFLYSAVGQNSPPFEMNASCWMIIAGGLLVGFGTRLGSGCTSGHGVCGLSRFSLRSLVAVVIFMAVGMATVSIVRMTLGA